MASLETFPPYDAETQALNVVIETPKGSRNKFTFMPDRAVFQLTGVLPAGSAFPYDFGFVPSTLGEDGDPLDILVLMDEPTFAGCIVPTRLIGVVEAEQTERDGKTTRNDRLIAIATDAHIHRQVKTLSDIGDVLIEEIEHFFVSYNDARGKTFKPIGRFGPAHAHRLVQEGERRRKENEESEDD